MLDPKLQPLPPDPDNPDSVRVFNEHKQLAQEYFRVQTEMAYTQQHKDNLAEQLSEEQIQQPSQQLEELAKLENEKVSDQLKISMNFFNNICVTRRLQIIEPCQYFGAFCNGRKIS